MDNVQIYNYNKINVTWTKLGKGKPLLILHGWGSNSQVMLPLAQKLENIRTCYLLDLPGFGKTPAPHTPWEVDNYADLIAAFMDEQEIDQADLLVHSFGGRITLKLCARKDFKDRIGKVLITGGAGMKPRRSLNYYVRKYTAKLLKAPFLILPETLKEKALSRLRQTEIWKSLGSGDYKELEGVMRQTFVKTVTEYLEPCLPKIPHEVLLLWGEEDQAAPLYQAKRMERGIKHAALVVIDNAGHYAFLDKPSQFISITRAFFKG